MTEDRSDEVRALLQLADFFAETTTDVGGFLAQLAAQVDTSGEFARDLRLAGLPDTWDVVSHRAYSILRKTPDWEME